MNLSGLTIESTLRIINPYTNVQIMLANNLPDCLEALYLLSHHTLSVCAVSLAAGFPTDISQRITVLSADALASTFLEWEETN